MITVKISGSTDEGDATALLGIVRRALLTDVDYRAFTAFAGHNQLTIAIDHPGGQVTEHIPAVTAEPIRQSGSVAA